jgi:hypothetical protein
VTARIGYRKHALVGQIPHGDDVEAVDVAWRPHGPLAGGGRPATLPRPAQLFEHGYLGVAAAAIGQQPCHRGGTGRVAGHLHRLPAAADRGVRRLGDQADHLGVLHRPADPGARKGHRRHMWQHGNAIGPVQPDQGVADAVQQRVTAGDHVHVTFGAIEERVQGGQHR